MTDEEISNLTTIDAFIQRKQPFAVYRIPGEKVPRLLTQAEGAVRLIYDLKELNGQRGFVIAPFQVSESCPVVLIQPDQWGQPLPMDDDTEEDREIALRLQGQESFLTSSTEEYTACFHTFINALRDRTFDKLVLSRHLTVDKVADFSPSSIFRAACKRYRIYTYVILRRQGSGWEALPKSFYRVRKTNGIRLRWPEHSLCKMADCRKYGMKRTGRNRIMYLLISVVSFFHWISMLRKTGHILLMPVLCHI